MRITIGTCTDDKRVLQKAFSGTDITVQLKSPCDILNPVFLLQYNAAYMTCNYIYCDEFKRYYYINNILLKPGNQMEISCSVDVLMSFADQILQLRTVIARQEYAGLTNVADSNVCVQNYNVIDNITFPTGFDVTLGSYVLETLGGN